MSTLQTTVNQNLLRYAVGRAIFCPGPKCGQILDVRRAVLVTVTHGEQEVFCKALCHPCAAIVSDRAEQHGWEVEALDGAALFEPELSSSPRPAPRCCLGYGARALCTKSTRDQEGLCRACRKERRNLRRRDRMAFDAAEVAWRGAR